ncbi:unnamed protein product [Rotaria sordida]|uniref:ABC transporter domain-containing protein n=1 Tax=Rotaria sordida TaxID=392033 RepID=A0A814N4P0_9BILA|nr:unnamed protein product [Rotaria sordida]
MNGHPRPISSVFRYMVGYVVQDDIFSGTLTVRENLLFSANLRLPQSVTVGERLERVDKIIEQLGLSECANTRMGTESKRGISGGERKRTCIAMEMVLSPIILFLDEPTTGLDAATACNVIKCLHDLSRKGCTIVFSIHQPRYSIFELFDTLLLMSHGRIVYLGLSTDMLSYFDKQGLLCKEHDNPADFALDILTEETDDSTTKDLYENYLRSPMHISTLAVSLNRSFTSEVPRIVQRGRSFACQFLYVSQRILRNARRNWQPYFWQNICAVLLGLLTGLLYYKTPQTSGSSVKNRLGCIFFVVANQIFSTATALEPFIKERALFIHEYVSGYYSRSIKHAEELCNKLRGSAATIRALHFDRDNSDIEKQLQFIQPDLIVDASGPFQSYAKDPYRVIKACLTTSINYLDFADGSTFVQGVTQFNAQAKANNIYILSGVSTCPLLTAAVVRRLAKGLTRIHSIKGGIAPSPYADVGLNVIRAISSYSGQRVTLVRRGQLTFSYAMTETMRYTICPPGHLPLSNRRFSLVDVPDLKILPDLWPNLDSIWIGAGTVPEILHRILNGLAWLVRWGLIPSLTPFASLFHWAMNLVRWGEHRGGMFISIEGSDREGQKQERSWHLLAEGDAGPFIPSMGIEAIVRRILDGKKPASGARAATMDLELDDYERIFQNHTIYTGQCDSIKTNSSSESPSLYQQLLDQAWNHLPQSLQTLHSKKIVKVAGVAQVERGASIVSRCVATLVGFPKSGRNVPVQVVFQRETNGELWTRSFAKKSFSSWQMKGSGHSDRLLMERFGPFTFGLALVTTPGKLHLIVRSWTLFGIRLPAFLAPYGDSYECDHDGRFCFHVEIKHILTGLIVRYHGWLVPNV